MSLLGKATDLITRALRVAVDQLEVQPLPTTTDETRKKEYIAGLKSWADEDKKVVLLWIAFDLAIVSLTLSEKIFDDASNRSPVVGIGVLSFLLSVILFFVYYHDLHMAIRSMNEHLLDLNCDQALHKIRTTWIRNSRIFDVASGLLVLGFVAFVVRYVSKISWCTWP